MKHHTTPYVDYRYRGRPCSCAGRVARLEQLLGLVCEHLNVDLDLLELIDRPTVRHGIPTSWDECIAAGIHPITGEPPS